MLQSRRRTAVDCDYVGRLGIYVPQRYGHPIVDKATRDKFCNRRKSSPEGIGAGQRRRHVEQ